MRRGIKIILAAGLVLGVSAISLTLGVIFLLVVIAMAALAKRGQVLPDTGTALCEEEDAGESFPS